MVCRNGEYPLLHSSSIAQKINKIERRLKDVKYLAAYFSRYYLLRENEHHICSNRHNFSLKPNISPSGKLFCRSIIISQPESWPIGNMLYYCPDSAQDVSLVHRCGVLALLSDSYPFTVRSVFTSASFYIQLSRSAQP